MLNLINLIFDLTYKSKINLRSNSTDEGTKKH